MPPTRSLNILITGDKRGLEKTVKAADQELGKLEAASKRTGAALIANIGGSGAHIGVRFKKGIAPLAGIAAAAGGVAGGALVGGIMSALDMGEANAKLSAQLGLNAKESARLGKIAGDLYASNYGDSLGHVNEALRLVTSDVDEMTRVSGARLKGLTGDVLSVAKVFDQDLGGVTRAVGQMMRTGLAKDSQTALNIITVGFQQGADKSRDFLDTLNEYGTQFRKLGLDGQTATGLIVQGLKAGARDADIVADSIKEFSIRALDGSVDTREGFKALGIDAERMARQIARGGGSASAGLDRVLDALRKIEDPVKRNRIAVKLFGTQAEDMGDALIALDPSSARAKKGLDNVAGAARSVNKQMGDTPKAKIEEFWRTLKQGATDVLVKLTPELKDAAERAKKFILQMEDGTGQGGKFADSLRDVADGAAKAFDGLSKVVRALNDFANGVQKGLDIADKIADISGYLPTGDGIGIGSMLPQFGGSASLMGANPGMAPFASAGARFGLHVSDGKRAPGTLTSSNNVSWHSTGEALDIAGPPGAMLGFFNYLKRTAGPSLAELIYTPGGAGIKNGQPHTYTGKVAKDHYDHVHVAKDLGVPGLGVGDGIGRAAFTGDGPGNYSAMTRGWNNGPKRPLTHNQVAALAESYGLPGETFAQIAKGESGYDPDNIGHDQGGTQGLGLWQITTKYNDDIIAKYGGPAAMLDAETNAQAARDIWKRQGRAAWYGTRYVTGWDLHYKGGTTWNGSGGSGGGGSTGSGKTGKALGPLAALGDTISSGFNGMGPGGSVSGILGGRASKPVEAVGDMPGYMVAQRARDYFNRVTGIKGGPPLKGRTQAEQDAFTAAQPAAGEPVIPPTEFEILDALLAEAELTSDTGDDLGILKRIREARRVGVDKARNTGDPRLVAQAIRDFSGADSAVKSLEESITSLDSTMQAHTEALTSLRDEVKRNSDLSEGVTKTSEFQLQKMFADLVSGKLGQAVLARSFTAGAAVDRAY